MSTPIVEPPPGGLRTPSEIFKSLPRAQAPQQQQAAPPLPGPSFNSAFAEARKAQQEQLGEFDWDPLWRPVQHALTVLTSGGAGVLNMVDKGLGLVKPLEENENLGSKIIGALPPVALAKGFWSSFTNNTDSEDYVMGHDVIENATDAFGSRFDPKYVDNEDNANPWVKGVGGFALDVALDPITYIPGGIIASGVRGGVRAGRLASGAGKVPAAARGVVKGTDAGDLKFGRFSGAVKPIGFEQWKANRALNKIDRIASKSGITSNNAVWTTPANLAKNQASFEQAAIKLNSDSAKVLAGIPDAKRLASAQKTYRTDWTAAKVEALGKRVEPLAKDLDEFYAARTAGQQLRVTTRRLTQDKLPGGASAYKYGTAENRNLRIVKQQQAVLAEQNVKKAFYLSMKGEAALVDEAADPLMSKVREAIGESFTVEGGGTQAQQGMRIIDDIYEAAEGTTEMFLRTQLKARLSNGTDFDVRGLGENTYKFTEVLESFISGKNIGLTGAEANLFGEVLSEFTALAHDMAPVIRSAAPTAPVAAPAKALAQEPSATPQSAADDVTESPFSVDVAPESILEPPPTPTGRAEGTVEILWDQATVNTHSDTARRLANTSKSLEKEIDEIYETEFDANAFVRKINGFMPAYVAGAIPPNTGALAEILERGRFDALIDTRHINSVGQGPTANYDKVLLERFVEKMGVRYHPIGEVIDGVDRNKAMHSPGSPTFGAIEEDADFAKGIAEIVERLNGSKRVALLVFEGTGTYNKKQVLVANALAKEGIYSRLVVQRGVPQGRETLDLIAEPLVRQEAVVREELASLLGTGAKLTEDQASIAARVYFRASAERQDEAIRKLLTQGAKEDWIANVDNMLASNAKVYPSVEAEIAARSNIITNLLLSNQNETEDLVVKLLSLGGASSDKRNVEAFFKSVFGDAKPVADSFSVEGKVAGGAPPVNEPGVAIKNLDPSGDTQYIVNEPEVVIRVIQALAELKTEIPGYTDKARAVLGEIAAETKIRQTSEMMGETVSEEMFGELGWVARTYSPAFRDNPGAHINIFGEVVEEGNIGVAAEMDRVVDTIARQFLTDAEVPPLIASEEVAKIFMLLADTAPTSNNAGRNIPAQRGTLSKKFGNVETAPLQQRWIENMPIDKSKPAEALREELGEPWKSTELNDIYDHVAGFATTPIGSFESWTQALKRVGESNSPYRFKARKLLKDTPETTSTKATTRQVEGTGAGRGTAQGDAKDAAMRAESNAAIVETSPKAGKESSSATTLAELGAPQGDMAGKTIMLARNGELSGKPLTKATEKAISDAARQGAKFVVGDMAKVDSAFHDLLNKLDAEYVIYHTGATPRTGALAPAAAGAGRAAYENYIKAFDLKVDASKNYGVDLFGRVFRDLTPEVQGSTRAMYAAFKDPKDKYFGDKLWKISLRHETRKGGYVHSDMKAFTEELNKEYGQTRTQELLPFIREIEATRLQKQAAATLAKTKENVNAAQTGEAPLAVPFADEIAARTSDDPLYQSLHPLERLPDELRGVVAEGILGTSITTVRGAMARVDKPAIVDWFRKIAEKKHVRYRIAKIEKKFNEDDLAKIRKRFDDPKIHQEILKLVKGGQVINTARSPIREALGEGPDIAETGAGGTFMTKWRGGDTGEGFEIVGPQKNRKKLLEGVSPTSVRGIRETMDMVRAEDMGEGFWAGLGGDFMVKWNPREDPDLNAFIRGTALLLDLDPLQDRRMLEQALFDAAAKSDGAAQDFLYSNFLVELTAGIRGAKTRGIDKPASREQTERIVLNGEEVEGFTREILDKTTKVKNSKELIDAVFKPNIYVPVTPEAVRGVMATLEEVSAATATTIPNQIRKKDVPGLFDRAKQEMIQATKTWNDYVVPNGEAIVARAAQLGDNGIVTNIARATETSANRIAKIKNVFARNLIQNSAGEAVKQSLKNMGDTGRRIFDQFSEVKAFEEIRRVLGTKFKANTPEYWKAQQIARAEYQALLRRSGVYQTTSINGKDNFFKLDLDKQHNWAYLDFMDTYRALVAGSGELDVLFREAMDLREIGGRRFPQTLLPELGVYAMQLARTGG